MGYDYDGTHESILRSAAGHFMEKGFRDASIRQICKDAGVTNGAFYAHFDSKEDLFRQLVEPALDGLRVLYAEENTLYSDITSAEDIVAAFKSAFSSDAVIVHYIYEHAEAFRLLLTASGGTSYDNLLDRIVEEERQGTAEFFERCRPFIKHPENITDNIAERVSSFIVSSVFGCFLRGMTEEETVRESALASEFCLAGLRKILEPII